MKVRTLGILAGLSLSMIGCVSQDDYNKALSERDSANRRLEEFSRLNDESSRSLETANADRQRKEQEAAALRQQNEASQRRIAELQGQIDELSQTQLPSGVTGVIEDGAFVYRVEGQLLFDSGKDELKSSGMKALSEISEILKGNDFNVEIAGHTDTDPVNVTKKKFKTNAALGAARALAVMEQIQKNGVPGERLHISSYGEFRPLDPADKSKNRRVEIRVLLKDAKPQ